MRDIGPPKRLARWVHWSLLFGIAFSGLLLISGLILTSIRGEPDHMESHPSPAALIDRALTGDGIALILLGLLALMATPALRVAVLAIGWGASGQFRFCAVALVVLALLSLAVFLGLG